MIETKISIGSIKSVDFYGVNNTKLQLIKNFFPRMTISARGNEIIAKTYTKDIIFVSNYGKHNKTKNQTKLIKQFSKNNLLSAIAYTKTSKTYTVIVLVVKALQKIDFEGIITPHPINKTDKNLEFSLSYV